MAVIDFSHATITAKTGKVWESDLGLTKTPADDSWFNTGSYSVNQISVKKKEYNYMGTVGKSGTKIVLGGSGLHPELVSWEIGGISYNGGDTYSFTIEVELP